MVERCEMGMVEGRLKRIRKRTVFMEARRPLINTPDESINALPDNRGSQLNYNGKGLCRHHRINIHLRNRHTISRTVQLQ